MIKDRLTILAIVLLPILILAGYLKPVENNPVIASKPEYNRFWTNKVHQSEKYNGIIIGDSRTYRGVDPATLTSKIQTINFFNFAFSAGGLNNEIYKATDERLKTDNNQKVILIGVTPWSLTQHAAANGQFRSEMGRTQAEVLDRVYFAYYTKFFNPVKPSVYIFQETKTPKELYYQEYYDNGWVASHIEPENQKKALKSSKESFTKNKVDEQLLNDLLKQIKRWSESGISVFVYRPPTTPELRQMEDEVSEFNENLLQTAVKLAGGTYIQVNINDYHSYDGSHLTETSARKFSSFLADEINRKGF